MKASGPFKTIALLFVAVLALYLIAYFAVEHLRTRRGPWAVTLSRDASGLIMQIDQHELGITNVQVKFPGAAEPANLEAKTVRFDHPRPVPYPLPVGECIFMDTTIQPGTVVIRLSGHEIQLLPRVLTIDNQEHAWRSGISITPNPITGPTNSLPVSNKP